MVNGLISFTGKGNQGITDTLNPGTADDAPFFT